MTNRVIKPTSVLLFLLFFVLAIVVFLFQIQLEKPNHNTSVAGQLIPIDDQYSKQKSDLSAINLESAWDITTGSRDVIVAVIDDAIDISHPDLIDNLMPGYDFVDNDNDPSPGACNGDANLSGELEEHGTNVAGIIGATGGNNQGIAGINWQVKILPLRIGCRYSPSLEAKAVRFAIENGAHIINASYGGPDLVARNQAVVDQLRDAEQQVLFVTSAGNYHVNNDDVAIYPGSLDFANIVTVTASDAKNQLTEWAQYGASSVDLAAPGVKLFTTTVGDSYKEVSGSSFSTAIVSGVAALAKSIDFNNALTAPDLKALLQASVTRVGSHSERTKTAGIVNARAALDLLNLPRPVLTINRISYEDSGTENENGELDPNENGNFLIEIENLWSDLVTGSIEISTNHPALQLNSSFFNLSPLLAGESKELQVPVQVGSFSGHQRIVFSLTISAIGASNNVTYSRAFEWQTGILPNKTQTQAVIQTNNFDDYQYFHVNIPANMERVAIELEYDKTDNRDMGLLAKFDQRPQIHFRSLNGQSYWHDASYRADDLNGFERIGFRIPAKKDSYLKFMVFNKPAASISDTIRFNKPYKIKSCFYSDSDGNAPPIVNAGNDINVNPGELVTITGSVSDSDGIITYSGWRSSSNIPITDLLDNKFQFTAPQSGTLTFTLEGIDNGCKRTVDSVVVTVNGVNGSIPDSLFLNPRTLNIDENSGFDVFVSATYNTQLITNLNLISAPSGVKYENGNLSWQNVSPVGQYNIVFATNIDDQSFKGTITINVKDRSVGNGGAGCVMLKNDDFDPLLWIYVLLSCFFIRKKSISSKKRY